jgi:hypothetical protein
VRRLESTVWTKPTVAFFGLSGAGAAAGSAGGSCFFIRTCACAVTWGAVRSTVSPAPGLASSWFGVPIAGSNETGSKSSRVSPFAVLADAPGAVPGGCGGCWRASVRANAALPMPDWSASRFAAGAADGTAPGGALAGTGACCSPGFRSPSATPGT